MDKITNHKLQQIGNLAYKILFSLRKIGYIQQNDETYINFFVNLKIIDFGQQTGYKCVLYL